MALSTKDRSQIYTRLAPMIGEKEAETLLDQFPSTADTEYATVADLKAVEARLDHRIDMLEATMNARFDLVESRFDLVRSRFDLLETSVEATIQKAMRRQTIWTIVTLVALLQLAARTNLFG